MLTSFCAIGSLVSVSRHFPRYTPCFNLGRYRSLLHLILSYTSASISCWDDVCTTGSYDGEVVLILHQYIATHCLRRSTSARQFVGEGTTISGYLCAPSKTRPWITNGFVPPLVPCYFSSNSALGNCHQSRDWGMWFVTLENQLPGS